MAFSTQRKFPGQCYEQNAVDEVNRTKSYNSIQDHRTWSMDDNQQANYLVDAIHKGEVCGEGDTIDFKDRHKKLSSDKEISEEIGVNTSMDMLNSHEHVFKSKISELALELEEIKLDKKTLEDENDDLRQRITDLIIAEDEYEDVQCRFDIIEEIILERNDLRALLDRVLGVTDKIVNLKTQLNHMERIESQYIILQQKCKEHQSELYLLQEEKKIFEKKILELEVNSHETDTLKTANMKLEEDLKELSSMISASDNFIQDQEISINSKLSTISQLQNQIENLKTSLMEADLKLNKKLRLEMDVELMEKELSIMIENSTDSVNPYNQQVIDAQVNDLAAAIKLTLGYMNCEFENDEDDNLVDANRQLKTLLLESSNKIFEFKDVINKQESNLIRVTNDFACKNDELTECLAIVDELKRQLANIEIANSQNKSRSNSKVVANITYTHDHDYELPENQHEILEIDLNLNSEYESDGQEIEILENIFEKSCAQGNKSTPKEISLSTDIHDSKLNNGVLVGMQKNLRNLRDELRQVKNDFENRREDILHSIVNSLPSFQRVRKQNDTFDVTYTSIEKTSSEMTTIDKSTNLSKKLEEMTNNVKDLQQKNEELKSQNRDLLSQIEGTQVSQISNEKEDEMETRLKNLQEEDHYLRLKHSNTHGQSLNLHEVFSDSPELKEKLDDLHFQNESFQISNQNLEQKLNAMAATIDKLQEANVKLETLNQNLLGQKAQALSQKKNEKFDDRFAIQMNNIKTQTSNESHLKGDLELIDVKIQTSNESHPKDDLTLINVKKLQNENEKLKIANNNLVAEIGELKSAENRSRLNILQMKNELEKLSVSNENLFDQSSYEKLSYSKSREQDVDGISPVVQILLKENEDLRSANENLSVEVKYAEDRARLDVLEKENEFQNLSAINESLLVEINVLKLQSSDQMEKKENEAMRNANKNLLTGVKELSKGSRITANQDLSNVVEMKNYSDKLRSKTDNLDEEIRNLQQSTPNVNELDAHMKELKNENEVLKVANESLIYEIKALKNIAFVETKKSCLEKSSSTNESLLIKESPVNLHNIETDWMTVDMKNLQNKNEKLLAELTELRRKLKSIENQSHLNTLGKKNDFKESSFTAADLIDEDKQSTQLHIKNNHLENDWMAVDIKKIQNKNEKLETANENLLAEINELRRRLEMADKRLHLNPFESKNYMEKSDNLFQRYQQPLPNNVQNTKTNLSVELKKLQNKNGSPKTVAKSSSLSIIQTEQHLSVRSECILSHVDEPKLADEDILTSHSPEMENMELDVKSLQKKNDELRSANENLSVKIQGLQNTDLDGHQLKNELLNLYATNDRLLAEINELKQPPFNNRPVESHWLTEGLEQLQIENDKLKISNKSLVAEISELRIKLLSTENLQKKNSPEKVLAVNEYSLAQGRDQQQLLSNNGYDLESSWMTTDLTKLQNKNEKLKIANESLVIEIRDLKNSENLAHKNTMQLERDLLKLSTINERLSAQLNDKKREKKMFSKCNDIEIDRMTVGDVKDLLKKNDELKNENENLVAKICDLKAIENRAQMDALELKKLTSINSSLMTQINQLKLKSDSDRKMESDWITFDTKKLLKKNKKLKAANEKLTTEISELHRELKNAENRAQRFDKKVSSKEVGHDAQPPDVNKLQRKNDELKSANEKLLTIIVNLKNSEKLAKSKSLEFEKELNNLKETNKNLQDTLENFVEKDSNNRKPKNELERLCQLILDEGISSLTDDEFRYLSNWFSSSVSAEFELKSSRAKIVTKKHCRICQNGPLESCRKNCECKQGDDKKRLNLLKEIEQTKLAIKHIQNSNDIEFDLNDVKNRLLKGKSPDPLDMEKIYEIQMDDTERSISVRTHFNKTTNDHQMFE